MCWDAIMEKSSLASMSTQIVTPPARTDIWKSASQVVQQSMARKPWHFSAAEWAEMKMNSNTNLEEGTLGCIALEGRNPRLRLYVVYCNILYNFYLMRPITIKLWSTYEAAVLLRELYRLNHKLFLFPTYLQCHSTRRSPPSQTHHTHFHCR